MAKENFDKEYASQMKIAKKEINRVAWNIYGKTKEGLPVSAREIVSLLLKIFDIDSELGCVLSLQYLNCGRIRELLQYTYNGLYSDSSNVKEEQKEGVLKFSDLGLAPIKKKSILRNQVRLYLDEATGEQWLKIKTRVEKRSTKKRKVLSYVKNEKSGKLEPVFEQETKEQVIKRYKKYQTDITKENDILYDEGMPEYPIVTEILEFLKYFDLHHKLITDHDKAISDLELFPNLKYDKVYYWLVSELNMTTHTLRAYRAQHLQQQGMNAEELRSAGGWAIGSAMPSLYAPATNLDKIRRIRRFKQDLEMNADREITQTIIEAVKETPKIIVPAENLSHKQVDTTENKPMLQKPIAVIPKKIIPIVKKEQVFIPRVQNLSDALNLLKSMKDKQLKGGQN